jgi:hypothetical protein
MTKVKDYCKNYNVPYKGKFLGTLEGDDLKKYIKAHLDSKHPEQLLKYFDNTMQELKYFTLDLPAKKIKKPKSEAETESEEQ